MGFEESRGARSYRSSAIKALDNSFASANGRPGAECAEMPEASKTHEAQGAESLWPRHVFLQQEAYLLRYSSSACNLARLIVTSQFHVLYGLPVIQVW